MKLRGKTLKPSHINIPINITVFPNKQTKPINPLHTMSKNVKNKVATGAQEKTFTVEVTLIKHETIHVETPGQHARRSS